MDLRERALDGALGARQPQPSGRDRAERDDDRLLVGEHERRDPEARTDPVAAPHAALALDRDAELLQPGDVAPDRARVDLEPAGDLAPRRHGLRLQELEEIEQARGRQKPRTE